MSFNRRVNPYFFQAKKRTHISPILMASSLAINCYSFAGHFNSLPGQIVFILGPPTRPPTPPPTPPHPLRQPNHPTTHPRPRWDVKTLGNQAGKITAQLNSLPSR